MTSSMSYCVSCRALPTERTFPCRNERQRSVGSIDVDWEGTLALLYVGACETCVPSRPEGVQDRLAKLDSIRRWFTRGLCNARGLARLSQGSVDVFSAACADVCVASLRARTHKQFLGADRGDSAGGHARSARAPAVAVLLSPVQSEWRSEASVHLRTMVSCCLW